MDKNEKQASIQNSDESNQSTPLKKLDASRIAAIAAVVSVLISISSLCFSFFVYQNSQTEQVIIRINRVMADYHSDFSRSLGIIAPGIFNTYWECLLSNTGDRTVSIINTDIHLYENGGLTKYSGLNGGIVRMGNSAPELPLTIKPGHTRKIIFLLRLPLTQKAYDILFKEYPQKNIPSLKTAYKLLARNHIDFFGNPLQPFIRDNKVDGFRVESVEKQPQLVFGFTTSQGKKLSSYSAWYMFPAY